MIPEREYKKGERGAGMRLRVSCLIPDLNLIIL